jgi:DivIVA domain-containing protein
MLTSAEVLNQKFAATKFREGYDQDEVDDFLDRVADTLKEREGVGHATRPVTAHQIDGIRFSTTKWREGYDQQEVDAFLDRVRQELGAEVVPPPEPVPARLPTAGSPALSATALVLRLQTMRSTRPLDAPDAVAVRLPDGTLRPVADLRTTADGIEILLG